MPVGQDLPLCPSPSERGLQMVPGSSRRGRQSRGWHQAPRVGRPRCGKSMAPGQAKLGRGNTSSLGRPGTDVWG